MTKGNSEETAANCTQRQGEALIELNRIREAAKRDKNLRFTSLMHHITVDLLREAYKALKRNAAPGIDEVTWRQYGEELEENLSKLHQVCKVANTVQSPQNGSGCPNQMEGNAQLA